MPFNLDQQKYIYDLTGNSEFKNSTIYGIFGDLERNILYNNRNNYKTNKYRNDYKSNINRNKYRNKRNNNDYKQKNKCNFYKLNNNNNFYYKSN